MGLFHCIMATIVSHKKSVVVFVVPCIYIHNVIFLLLLLIFLFSFEFSGFNYNVSVCLSWGLKSFVDGCMDILNQFRGNLGYYTFNYFFGIILSSAFGTLVIPMFWCFIVSHRSHFLYFSFGLDKESVGFTNMFFVWDSLGFKSIILAHMKP